jgi:predicted MFS family arabinose efflux permease
MLLGDVAVGRFCRPELRERLAFPLAMLIGAPLLALAFRPPLPAAAAALLLCRFGYAYPLGIQQALLDSLPERLRGQGFGLNTTGQMGGQGLLPAAAGGVAALAGPATAMAAAGAAVMITASALRRPLTDASR